MRKRRLSSYYITLLLILQVFVGITGANAAELSPLKKAAISENCETIKTNLKIIQRDDAKIRVLLGRYYETILTDFVTPLNVRLVENNLSNANLVENQNSLADGRTQFVNDYISYQQGLEELVSLDCKNETSKFYDKLTKVRDSRAKVKKDALKMRNLANDQAKLVEAIMKDLEESRQDQPPTSAAQNTSADQSASRQDASEQNISKQNVSRQDTSDQATSLDGANHD